jgi:hypothetical protein
MRSLTIRIGILTCIAMAGLAQPSASQPNDSGQIDHPKVDHPSVPVVDPAQWPKAKAEDVMSTEAIVAAYYASSSGKAGESRDWNRFQSLFHPQARLIAARSTFDGGAGVFVLSPAEYVEQNRKYFEKSGFIDSEAARRVEAFGNVAHVWSTYESRRAPGAEPYSRGIASIQLLKDGGRWWIMNVFWDHERPDCRVPEKYMTTPKP